VGTRVWKEFSFGRRVETRYMERLPDGSWLFATYLWSPDGSDALRAPAGGLPAVIATGPGTAHDIPSVGDCLACHGAGPTAVLGFSALQLSPDRDPLAPHAEHPAPGALDLPGAVRERLVTGLAPALLLKPPRVNATSADARAALGYLHASCGGCHDARGELSSLGLDLTQRVVLTPGAGPAATAIDAPSRYRPPGWAAPALRIAPGRPEASTLIHRISTRHPSAQMPPLGTHVVDEQAVALVRSWVAQLGLPRDAGSPPAARPGITSPTEGAAP
jgi:hypothetical protein